MRETLKRIETFKRNVMSQKRLYALAIIQIKINSGMHCLVLIGIFAQIKIIMHLFFSS